MRELCRVEARVPVSGSVPHGVTRQAKVTQRPIWLILDSGRHIATGCAEGEAQRAEQILAAYIAQKYRPERRDRDLEAIE
jgi:hypothetical protein